ncbi:XdhC family protein [Paracoccus saliphilus]|uniref:XdhC family protein n=2 Tax=Paracoccus saliphilus TaxID=405559 RepID=A0ABY7SGI0_9RHOB|nr:XdhC family protein [Paracoccus saliphilus]WCR04986.1 XdhC family protein [Paracoccus saliphilus]
MAIHVGVMRMGTQPYMSDMMIDPLAALHARPGGALALLVRAEGGFPRRPGAAMALWPDGARVGRLGAGCIDADIAAHLDRPGPVTRLIYGAGGPVDLPLPCGGTVEIALLHRPDPVWLQEISDIHRARRLAHWRIDLETGCARRTDALETGLNGGFFGLKINPRCILHIHGEGDEASALAAMARAVGLDCRIGATASRADAQTAVVTLFHDHDRELPALRAALESPAFYIGALGSRRAQMARIAALREAGFGDAELARLRGPIGVVAPVREPRLLAASVLTEILAAYEQAFG